MHTLFFTAIAVCFLEKVTTIGAQTCYFPNGSAADRDIPCRAPTSNQASACCAYSDICLDNSLCLAQSGVGIITRGSCTDQSWQSSECARYCQDVTPYTGALIYPVLDGSVFCCGMFNTSTNACMSSTRGSTTPFRVPDGRVIYNRTSGAILPINGEVAAITVLSTLPIQSDIATVTVAATATITTIPSSSTIYDISPCSSSKPIAVGLGVGLPFGLALFGALGMMWRQRSRELGARGEARAWEKRYDEIRKENRGDSTGVEGQLQELGHGWGPNELDGDFVHEVAGRL